MTAIVRFVPSRHEIINERHETILEAALRAGLPVSYGCTNGSCGQCKAKLISGQLEKTQFHDYVLTQAEKEQGVFLLCSHAALTDAVVEVTEAKGVQDIPLQEISTRIKKIDHPAKDVVILTLRTPRSKSLRFIAGQRCGLSISPDIGNTLSIASCPCDSMNLQFHIRHIPNETFSEYVFSRLTSSVSIDIIGPSGEFILDEDSTRPILFIAFDTDFGPVKSLIEHAISLELSQPMHFYWLSLFENGHYLHNYCRSLMDAMDNFEFTPLVGFSEDQQPDSPQEYQLKLNQFLASQALIEKSFTPVFDEYPDMGAYDVYIAAPSSLVSAIKPLFLQQKLPNLRLFVEMTDQLAA